MGASNRFLGMIPVVLGTLLGGVLGERIGVPATIVFGAVGGVLPFLWLIFSPVRSLRAVPAPAARPPAPAG